jgi:hypothetical protein
MPEQIRTDQISGYSPGGRVETKLITLSGGTGDYTTPAFSFVVGPVMIELLTDNSDNGVAVYSVLWANMRSFSGGKTANVTDRTARGPGNGGFLRMAVDRTTSGTVLVISRPFSGTETNPDGSGGLGSIAGLTWPSSARLRVTAWEDMQS